MQCLAAADRAQVQAPTRSRMHVMRCRLARTPCTATALNCSHGVCYRWLEPRVVTHKLLKFPFFVISDSRKCAWSRSHHKPCYTSGRRRLPGTGTGLTWCASLEGRESEPPHSLAALPAPWWHAAARPAPPLQISSAHTLTQKQKSLLTVCAGGRDNGHHGGRAGLDTAHC